MSEKQWYVNVGSFIVTNVEDVDSRGVYLCMGHALWELSVFSTPFCCEPKAVFKNKVY